MREDRFQTEILQTLKSVDKNLARIADALKALNNNYIEAIRTSNDVVIPPEEDPDGG